MHKSKKTLIRRRRGETQITALILLITIVIIGAIIGMVSIRNHLTQEFGDAAVGLESLDQSFSYQIDIDTDNDGNPDITQMASYTDQNDYGPALTDPVGDAPAGLDIQVAPGGETP